MNERIEELSLQCIRYKLIAEGARSDFDYKKFAELIVRECIEIVEPCKCGCCDVDEFLITRSIISQIKEHFGVEE